MINSPIPSPEAEALPTLPVVAQVHQYGATVRLDWASVHAAHNAKPGALTPHAPAEAAIVALRAEVAELRKDAERLTEAVRWVLGERDDFPVRMEGEGRYWWRAELRRRAGLLSDKEA